MKSSVDVTLRNGGFLAVAQETIDELTMEASNATIVSMFILNRERHDDFDDNVGGVITLTDTVSVTGSGTAFVGSDAGNGRFRLNPGSTTPREFNVAAGASLKIIESLSEGDLRKTGDGALFLRPGRLDNTHGNTFIDDGALFLESGFSPDTPLDGRTIIPHDLFIRNGARVVHRTHSNVIADTANVHLSDGAGLFIADGVEETINELTAEGGSRVEVSDEDTELTVVEAAEIRGGSQLTAGDEGRVTFQALTRIQNSTVESDGGRMIFSDLDLAAGVVQSANGGSVVLAGNVLTRANAASSQFQGELTLSPGEHEFTVADGSAAIDLAITALIRDGVFSGSGDNASLRKLGLGRMLLAGDNTHRGQTIAAQGTLVINGQNNLNQEDVFVLANGVLTGLGRVREITLFGGILAPGAGVGRFTAVESAFLGSNSRFIVQINGPAAAQFDQLVTGELKLGNPAEPPILDVKLGFTPAAGQQFRIVNVTGNTVLPADRVFQDLQGNDLPEGASFKVNGLDFTITYKGGNGQRRGDYSQHRTGLCEHRHHARGHGGTACRRYGPHHRAQCQGCFLP